MRKAGYRDMGVVAALLAAAALVTVFQPATTLSPRAGIRMVLPERVGTYAGVDVRFCQDANCPASFAGSVVRGADSCPMCGGRLDLVSPAERQVLPADTVIVRKQYTHAYAPPITVAIVLSGTEQRSIHRPQQCLPAQGLTIEGGRVVSVELKGREPLEVMLLEARDRHRPALTWYAYWFVGVNRATPYHLQRLLWMATDRILHGVSHRWAYVSLTTSAGSASADEQARRLTAFIAALYPMMQVEN